MLEAERSRFTEEQIAFAEWLYSRLFQMITVFLHLGRRQTLPSLVV